MKREAVEIIKILASAAMGALIIIQFVTPMTVLAILWNRCFRIVIM